MAFGGFGAGGGGAFGASAGGFGSGTSGGFGATSLGVNAQQQMSDHTVTSPPADSVQVLEWSPNPQQSGNTMSYHLAGGAWDKSASIWEVKLGSDDSIQSSPILNNKGGGAVLDLAWDNTGQKVFIGGADKTLKMWDLATQQATQIGSHDQPVKSVHFIPQLNCVMTGSWDKTLKFWDCRQPQPVVTKQLTERVYDADVCDQYAMAATADKFISIYQIGQGQTPIAELRQDKSSMKMQVRCITAFKPEQNHANNTTQGAYGYALGSIEGRVSIQYLDPNMSTANNFAFKCHRDEAKTEIHIVNSISFHPVHHTFATCGSDGKFVFWDKDSKQRLKAFEKLPALAPITSGRFSPDGRLFGYAFSYDWAKGHSQYTNAAQIMIHNTQFGKAGVDECAKKPSKQRR